MDKLRICSVVNRLESIIFYHTNNFETDRCNIQHGNYKATSQLVGHGCRTSSLPQSSNKYFLSGLNNRVGDQDAQGLIDNWDETRKLYYGSVNNSGPNVQVDTQKCDQCLCYAIQNKENRDRRETERPDDSVTEVHGHRSPQLVSSQQAQMPQRCDRRFDHFL